eukprot:jgi/Chlat1/5684/Chrsp37S05491
MSLGASLPRTGGLPCVKFWPRNMAQDGAVRIAQRTAVLVRAHGPDPKMQKLQSRPFYRFDSGTTTLSCSGVLLPDCAQDETRGQLVVTVHSVVEPFLRRSDSNGHSAATTLELLPRARVEVLLPGTGLTPESQAKWFTATLIATVPLPEAAAVLSELLNSPTHGGPNNMWMQGWTASVPPKDNAVKCAPNASSAAVLAVLSIRDCPAVRPGSWQTAAALQPGERLMACGSPFGLLSPLHFFNTVAAGILSSTPFPGQSASIAMVDIRCHPGMEGGPIITRDGHIVGMVCEPLRQRQTHGEVQIMLTADGIASALYKQLGIMLPLCATEACQPASQSAAVIGHPAVDSSVVSRACQAVVLIETAPGSWASGVIISSQGHILTNAHLLEPERFKRKARMPERFASQISAGSSCIATAGDSTQQPICRVKVNGAQQSAWLTARVIFVAQGALDVALLQLLQLPESLHFLSPARTAAVEGMPVAVMGHGLFGPTAAGEGVVNEAVLHKLNATHPTDAAVWALALPNIEQPKPSDSLQDQMVSRLQDLKGSQFARFVKNSSFPGNSLRSTPHTRSRL